MPSIRILSDRVANQIAAGEVIERPVAVVKELVENSIDSGATRIEVEFRNGGKSYIRIQDNGSGMAPDEALLALERHATSKIREADDLNTVASFGFRGEALPSIASVSKFTLRTRSADHEHGTEVTINGGKLLNKRDCGMPIGTTIEVAQLFNSVPARRKFLKTDATETAHITYTTRLFAVAHPHIAFRLLENGRTLFQSPACERLSDRIAEIWGRQLAADLIPIDVQEASSGLSINGLIAKPGVGRNTRRELITLVNHRPVDSRTLGFAVLDAYQGRIQKGRFPPAFLFVTVDPQEIDVNVHPAKREIRFRNEGAIRRFVLNAVSTTLDQTKLSTNESPLPAPQGGQANVSAKPAIQPPRNPKHRGVQPEVVGSCTAQTPEPIRPTVEPTEGRPPVKPQVDTPQWKLITRLQQHYALFESPRGLVMLHIRHAHQRVRFETIQKSFHEEAPTSQRLLLPLPLEFEPLAAEALQRQLKQLNSYGFDIQEFGRNFYRIEAVPTWLDSDHAEDFIRDLIDAVRQRDMSRKPTEILTGIMAQLATKHSYQANDPINAEQVEALLRDLLRCDNPHTAPNGKPTLSEISWSDWRRRLGDD